jgi:tRNA-dihydrouridine synthase A
MVTTGALIHGDRNRFLRYDDSEHPVAYQLGGSEPEALATCAVMIEEAGYDEVNLNCGCPSDRVQTGNFGACLMKSPDLVADCVDAMVQSCGIPVTVKNRLGVDELDSYDFLTDFIGKVSEKGCQTFYVHARKAWLQGLSPKQNREIPPLLYERVYQLKKDFPKLEIIINGGVKTLDECEQHLEHVDGVMIGREAYHNPYMLADVDRRFYDDHRQPASREAVLEAFSAYAEEQIAEGVRINHMSRHILGLFANQPGGRKFRRFISDNAWKGLSADELFNGALAAISAAAPQPVESLETETN